MPLCAFPSIPDGLDAETLVRYRFRPASLTSLWCRTYRLPTRSASGWAAIFYLDGLLTWFWVLPVLRAMAAAVSERRAGPAASVGQKTYPSAQSFYRSLARRNGLAHAPRPGPSIPPPRHERLLRNLSDILMSLNATFTGIPVTTY